MITHEYDANYMPLDARQRGHWETVTATSLSAAQKAARQHAAKNNWRLFQIVPASFWQDRGIVGPTTTRNTP